MIDSTPKMLKRRITVFIAFIILVSIVLSLMHEIPECWEDEILVRETNFTATFHCVAVDDLDHGYRP